MQQGLNINWPKGCEFMGEVFTHHEAALPEGLNFFPDTPASSHSSTIVES